MLSSSGLFSVLRETVSLALLDRVQLVIPLQQPTHAEFVEIARRKVAARGSEVTLSDDVLVALAAAAARWPRLGHELTAMLGRVLAGSWSLHTPGKDAGGKPPGRRGRRKGST